MTAYTLRLAVASDAEAGAHLHLACWRESYADLLAPDRLAAVTSDETRWITAWREQLQPTNPRWLAEVDGELVGFACAGPDRTVHGLLGLELYAIYVRRAWHGSGLGQALLGAAIGDQACSVWVLENNQRALAFYARNGFQPDGQKDFDETLAAWEVRLVR
jgi:GNAT superfamily N-acetyltransferase